MCTPVQTLQQPSAANAPTGGLNKNAGQASKKIAGQGKESVVGSTERSLPKRSGHL